MSTHTLEANRRTLHEYTHLRNKQKKDTLHEYTYLRSKYIII